MNEFLDPTTGELVDPRDIDGMLEAYQRISDKARELWDARREAAHRLARLTAGDQKTRYLRGDRLRAKVTMPSDSWDSGRLKEIWFDSNALARQYLRIERVAPIAKEVKKLEKEAGDGAFAQFRERVLSCRSEPAGSPSISIVE